MIKLALAALLLASSAAAQIRLPNAAAQTWMGPVAGVAAALKMEGVGRLGTVSLPRLTFPNSAGYAPMLKDPALLEPLAAVLSETTTPERFRTMPLPAKAEILRAAAREAEARAGMKVWSLVQETHAGIGRSRFSSFKTDVNAAQETRFYLNDRGTKALALLEERVHQYERARADALAAFMADLPAKLMAGAFDGAPLVKEKDGAKTLWLTADGDPRAAYGTPEEALDARIAALELNQPGPWTAADARSLRETLDKGVEAGDIGLSRWTVSARERLEALETRAAGSPALMKPAKRVLEGRPSVDDVVAVEGFYRDAYRPDAFDHRVRARMLGTIHAGGAGLPSWDRLQEVRRALYARSSAVAARSMRAFGAVLLTVILLPWVVAQPLGMLGQLAFVVAACAALLAPALLAWVAADKMARLERADAPLDEDMRRFFNRRS